MLTHRATVAAAESNRRQHLANQGAGGSRLPCHLHRQGSIHQTEAGTTGLLGYSNPHQAQLTETAPAGGMKIILAVDQRVQHIAVDRLCQGAPQAVLDGKLLFGQVKLHLLSPHTRVARQAEAALTNDITLDIGRTPGNRIAQ